ncbi:hypothetical protein [Lactiplantibacillus mudanjiangensis]|uniref:Uncharacterized protein n=1 Tax=Lactiplantibacillus mudanjiangensis TaxID=1296538 RepID=A0A660E665_9LACO|nr:hypothetical protein [Lactiplantibacillus mudanjiangensis]VDG18042.1 hypothetical protein MUDAN_BIHEEGNE_00568 [Lactiplantibacillus mudanjiangensis]VDG24791.1 hypothetical protein MUDAN_IGPPGNFN_00821 [Lactiplantibacillus mudanjiangensis]VDG28463.1 hypothetical protein MUDAN_MDHGFNIF_00649 [Lactiplantibacillus mudanjiangensis]
MHTRTALFATAALFSIGMSTIVPTVSAHQSTTTNTSTDSSVNIPYNADLSKILKGMPKKLANWDKESGDVPMKSTRDTSDTGFWFKLYATDTKAAYAETPYRVKQNASGVYEETTQHTYTHRNPGWVRGSNANLNASRYNDAAGHYYDLAYNRSIHMYNTVKENGHKMAAISVGADPGKENFIWGNWSPDSK